jgi:hypothetical protein
MIMTKVYGIMTILGILFFLYGNLNDFTFFFVMLCDSDFYSYILIELVKCLFAPIFFLSCNIIQNFAAAYLLSIIIGVLERLARSWMKSNQLKALLILYFRPTYVFLKDSGWIGTFFDKKMILCENYQFIFKLFQFIQNEKA